MSRSHQCYYPHFTDKETGSERERGGRIRSLPQSISKGWDAAPGLMGAGNKPALGAEEIRIRLSAGGEVSDF